MTDRNTAHVAGLLELGAGTDGDELVLALHDALAAGRARIPLDGVPGYERVAALMAPRLASDDPHPGAVAAAALIGDVGWLSLGLALETRVLLLVHAAEACGIPFLLFGRDDRALFAEVRRLPWRLAMAARLRDAVYDLQGNVLEWREGDVGSATYGEGCVVEWHELLPAEVTWAATWWLDDAALPDAYWARVLYVGESVRVRDLDGATHSFSSQEDAQAWLWEEEYEPYEELLADGEIPHTLQPPLDWLGPEQ